MKLFAKPPAYFLLFFVMVICCRKIYNPPAITAGNHFFAIDGFINIGPNTSTSITVSRSLNLSDTIPNIPELGAQVVIRSSNGNTFALRDTAGNGVYISDVLNLDPTQNYQLDITGADGNKYLSDFVPAKQAPAIDSVSWELVNDPVTLAQAVNIYVNSHDPNNNTHYYRWDYLQTYKHLSVYESPWGEANGLIFPYDPTYSTHSCWSTVPSSNILLGTSIALNQDVISHIQVANIVQNDPTMDIGSSFLIRQFPLTEQGYNYWVTVQKNSQSLGGLFDLQPAQIKGNLHCTTNPNNPALGYVSASSVQEKRIYISNKNLPGWKSNQFYVCPTEALLQDQLNLLIYNYGDTSYGPYHFEGDFTVYLVVAPKRCMDCRYQGGINIKPDFWPQYD
ncbi:MAG: DUF4249 domain-containing protein [Bacteroidota bacterium]|nr:DUF4249 domain-containing protein [Bacteroidota bacterium]